MKLKVNKKDLLNLLAKPQNIVEKRNSMPILVNVLLEATEDKLKIFATDLEISLTHEISAKVEVPGKVAVSAKNFFDLIKELAEGEISLHKQENNWLKIKQQKAQFNLVGISAEEYPVFPTYNTNDFMVFNSKSLKEMIAKTIYSVSNDETRYHLNGVYFENIAETAGKNTFRMVATDGHRLSLIDKTIESDKKSNVSADQGVIIPKKGLHEIKKIIESEDGVVELAFEGAQLIVRLGSTILMIRLIEGKYPNYKQLIPDNLKEQITLDKETLVSSLKRVSLLSNQKSKGVTLKLSKGRMEISSNNPDLGDAKEELEIPYAGKDFKIGFNAKYILEILNTIEEDNVSLELSDQLSPGLFRPDNKKDYTCVIMPMRI